MKRTPLKSNPKPCCGKSLCSCGTRTLQRSRINPINRRRRKREFARAYGSSERAAWVKQQPCVVCYATPSENAHIEGAGMGRKADADKIVPLCHRHHVAGGDSFHALGSADAFNDRWNVDLYHAARVTEARWQQHNED